MMPNFVKALESKSDLYKLTGASAEQVSQAEKSLGVNFANEYREYLITFGAASANAHEFTGICQSPRLNVVDVTLSERKKNTLVPCDYYVIEQAGIDRIIIWQSSSGEIYTSTQGTALLKLCASLFEYLEM